MKLPDWITALVLGALLFALYMNWSWPWGVLFIYWAIPAYLSGEAFLVGTIARRESPALFWIVTMLWVLLGVMMILADIAPATLNGNTAVSWSLS